MERRSRDQIDALTPREQEVLALIRHGYSNRGIAETLGISLAGAKFHVSEIIGKLGVSSREEAAAWQREPSRRWGFAPAVILSGLRQSLVSFSSAQLVTGATLAVLLVGGIGLAGFAIAGRDESRRVDSDSAFDPCGGAPGCRVIRELRYATVEEAAANASFVPMFPAVLPDGFERHIVLALERDLSGSYPWDPREVHNDWITVVYRNAAGRTLVIAQGFPARPGVDQLAYPGSEVGRLDVNGRESIWSENAMLMFQRPEAGPSGTMLTLFIGKFGTGWGGEGSFFSGSPMTYSVGSDFLDLNELIAIAESVTFPNMLEPAPGVTPDPYFRLTP